MKKKALLSLSDKTELVPFAEKLLKLDYEIYASDGTAAFLSKNGILAQRIETLTEMPEMMGGRIKTLHPRVHGGILMRREHDQDKKDCLNNNIHPIEIVCVNLYPFEKKWQENKSNHEEMIEHIDIGGVALLRAAAKNYRWVYVVTEQKDYPKVIQAIEEKTEKTNLRLILAQKAFAHTMRYDAGIAQYLENKIGETKSHYFSLKIEEKLRYGENLHESGWLGKINAIAEQPFEGENNFLPTENFPTLRNESLLWGKMMSYNNYLDSYEACQIVSDFSHATAVVVKHSNPCGLAKNSNEDISMAIKSALDGDVVSSYGSIIALNRTLDVRGVAALKNIFIEIILAPDYEDEALEMLKKKSRSLRILRLPELDTSNKKNKKIKKEWRMLDQIVLIKKNEQQDKILDSWNVMSKKNPKEEEKELYLFAFRVAKHVKSNAIAIAYKKEETFQLLSIGAGQPNRVDSIAKLALTKAEENLKRLHPNEDLQKLFSQCVLASDAFFPFADGISIAEQAGIKKFIQPGGSIRDQEVIDEVDKKNACMVFTKMRHFKH